MFLLSHCESLFLYDARIFNCLLVRLKMVILCIISSALHVANYFGCMPNLIMEAGGTESSKAKKWNERTFEAIMAQTGQ